MIDLELGWLAARDLEFGGFKHERILGRGSDARNGHGPLTPFLGTDSSVDTIVREADDVNRLAGKACTANGCRSWEIRPLSDC